MLRMLEMQQISFFNYFNKTATSNIALVVPTNDPIITPAIIREYRKIGLSSKKVFIF